MKILKSSIILAIAFITMLLNGCEDNEADAPNINPETGTLSGAITFVGTWPDSGSVLLTLDVQFFLERFLALETFGHSCILL